MEIGIDIVKISRFDKEKISNEKFLNKIFTKNEIEYCKKKDNPSKYFATRFAGKESVIKALSSFNEKINFKQIEILNEDNGRPFVKILNNNKSKYNIKISMSHSFDEAIASVIIDKINELD